MSSPSAFQITVRSESGGSHVVVSGPIDERSEFGQAGAQLARARVEGQTSVVFDLSGVAQLNSVGVKKWLSFLGTLGGFELRFARISEMIVAQANVVSLMLGPPGTPVISFAAPYLCGGCDKEFSRELTLGQLKVSEDDGYTAPALPCEECGGQLAFDEYEDEYFFFLKRAGGE